MKVAVLMGSDSDWNLMRPAVETLKSFGIESEVEVASAHRTPAKVRDFVMEAPGKGVGAFIVGAGGAAHLAGVVASYTTLPVIGVPISSNSLNGMDSLLSTVQMPSGVPVATMAINGSKNAALFAVQIFAVSDKELAKKLVDYRSNMIQEVDKKAARVKAQL
ncbi:5-(carboxyamino)imidazole ribonucleotide mutase [uncultured Selenomonas sp.]|uniref:5-(carboxyamino)imidazole ribonucleotide mutase n=1 Tax=uncultured Selenomonas sp. TaxID=159275 RepID=UPI0025FE61BE|nr:5-(carboxyamino)imidazole ribonucleotide mutase [uncultured Selenomonas sp.]